MTSLDINANPGEREEDEVEMSSMRTVTRRRRSKNSSEYDDFGLIEVNILQIFYQYESCNDENIVTKW